MNEGNFFEMYAARFRPLTSQDGLSEWKPLISAADPAKMRQALDGIVEHHQRIMEETGRTVAAPRLGEVRASYNRLASQPEASAPRQPRNRPTCGECDNGHLWFLVAMDAVAIADIRQPRATYPGKVAAMRSVCICQDDVNGQPGELPPDEIPYFARREHAEMALAKWEGREYDPAAIGGTMTPGGLFHGSQPGQEAQP
jgi:hypothetical protein